MDKQNRSGASFGIGALDDCREVGRTATRSLLELEGLGAAEVRVGIDAQGYVDNLRKRMGPPMTRVTHSHGYI
jgi:hypothetical protein